MTSCASDRSRRRYHFERRCRAAEAGRHLPTLEELLRGSPFLGNDISADAHAFAERVLPRISDGTDEGRAARAALEALTFMPGVEEFRVAAAALEMLHGAPFMKVEVLAATASVRCSYYAAAMRNRDSVWTIAAEAVSRASASRTAPEEAAELAAVALGWLIFASSALPTARRLRNAGEGWGDIRQHVLNWGERLVETVSLERGAIGASGGETDRPSEQDDSAPVSEPSPCSNDSVVVLREVGNGETPDGKRVHREFEAMLKKPLPLLPMADARLIRSTLVCEFPWAENVVDGLLSSGIGYRNVRIHPAVLVGAPGCGKTTFAARLLSLLGVPHEIYSCGGIADASLSGTPRRWTSGEPSLPVSLIRRWQIASPGIVLDEVEKVATSRHNGNLLDALLGLLEKRSASAWYDPYLEAPVDVSHVIWLATANSLDGVPAPLRDRCRVFRFLARQAPQVLGREVFPNLERVPHRLPPYLVSSSESRSDSQGNLWRVAFKGGRYKHTEGALGELGFHLH